MRKIKTYSKKYYTLKINTIYYNPITLFRCCLIPREELIPFDINDFNYQFEKAHGLLGVSEDSQDYSYS